MPSSGQGEHHRTSFNAQSLPVLLTRLLVNLVHTSSARGQSPVARNTINNGNQDNSLGSPIPDTTQPALLTLHLLYPHILLDALDLLDRNCVIQLNISKQREPQASARTSDTIQHDVAEENLSLTQQRQAILKEMADADQPRDNDAPTPDNSAPARQGPAADRPGTSRSYYVRSAQPPPHRYAVHVEEGPYAQSKGYTIHLTAWNCSCPAFAYAAFVDRAQVSEEAKARIANVMGVTGIAAMDLHGDPEVSVNTLEPLPFALKYGFGGLDVFQDMTSYSDIADRNDGVGSLRVRTGRNEKLPACCKHLMACVLAEAMPSVFGDSTQDAESAGRAASVKGIVQKWIDVEEAAGWAAGGGFG